MNEALGRAITLRQVGLILLYTQPIIVQNQSCNIYSVTNVVCIQCAWYVHTVTQPTLHVVEGALLHCARSINRTSNCVD